VFPPVDHVKLNHCSSYRYCNKGDHLLQPHNVILTFPEPCAVQDKVQDGVRQILVVPVSSLLISGFPQHPKLLPESELLRVAGMHSQGVDDGSTTVLPVQAREATQ
jgi:hypothetical protein